MTMRRVAYGIATGLTAFVFIAGGAFDLARPSFLMKDMDRLGYPAYFPLIIGVWKILGGLVVVAPRLPILKEWAYAGMVFDLSGAAISHAAVSDPIGEIAPPVVILGIVLASWFLRPKTRRARGVAASIDPAPTAGPVVGAGI